MLSKKTWLVVAFGFAVWAVWHSLGAVEVVYNVRHLDDGTVRESKVVCGHAIGIVFAGSFDPDVPGSATAADCRAAARTRLLEVGLLAIAGAGSTYLGVRYGKEPPRPIDQELPRLPGGGDRTVEGRPKRS